MAFLEGLYDLLAPWKASPSVTKQNLTSVGRVGRVELD